MTLHVRQGGVWKTVIQPHVRQGGLWKPIQTGWVRQGGVWKMFYVSAPPAAPVVAHTAYGQFTIANYDPKYTYTLTHVSGTVGAAMNAGVVTLSGVNSRYRVDVAYAPGIPQSSVGFMERKAYTYTLVNQPYACGSHQCNCRSEWMSCGCECAGGGCGCYGNSSQSWGQCGCPGTMCWYNQQTVCDTCTSYCDNWVNVKDSTPAGYADAFGEWSKVV